tara:strand:+ start:722 stop:1141 length:420 start_codon:yes stop_codon:yes gene_type:complete
MALWSELAATLDWNRAVGVWSAPIDAPNVEKFMSEAGATADVLGVSRDMSEWEEGLLYLIGVENSGTGTADVTFQASPDRGMTWMDHTAFTQLTATANEMIKLTQIPRRGRIHMDATGTTDWDITVYFEGTKKRVGRGV